MKNAIDAIIGIKNIETKLIRIQNWVFKVTTGTEKYN